MAERKKTPNILADLLGNTGSTSALETQPTAKQEASLPASLQNGKTVIRLGDQNSAVTISDEIGEESDGGLAKVKVTFYLSEESVDMLEEAQRKLRRLGRGAGKTQSKATTSKSALLEEALKLACAELEDKGRESQLARILF